MHIGQAATIYSRLTDQVWENKKPTYRVHKPVVRQSELIMTTYFIHTKVKRVCGHEGDLSVRCVPGRGVDNEDMGWLLESAAQGLWLSVFSSAAQLLLFFMLHMTLHR